MAETITIRCNSCGCYDRIHNDEDWPLELGEVFIRYCEACKAKTDHEVMEEKGSPYDYSLRSIKGVHLQ